MVSRFLSRPALVMAAFLAVGAPTLATTPDLVVELPLGDGARSLDPRAEGPGHLSIVAEAWDAHRTTSLSGGPLVDGLPCKVVVLQGRPWVRAVSVLGGDAAQAGLRRGEQGGAVYSGEAIRALREKLVAQVGNAQNVRLRSWVTWTSGQQRRAAWAPVVELGTWLEAVDALDQWLKGGALIGIQGQQDAKAARLISLGGNLRQADAPAAEFEEKKEAPQLKAS